MRTIHFILGAMLVCTLSQAQTRTIRTVNDHWTFTREGVSSTVNLPHTWNADDTWDEEPGFYRGPCTYERTVRINGDLDGKNVYLRFEGANQETEAYVNGKFVGAHVGGYSAFIFDITDAVKNGDNDFLIKVNNRHNPDIAPLSADFTFYGGIYRDLELVFTPKNQISNTHYASSGVYLTTPKVSPECSEINVCTHLNIADPGRYILNQQVFDPQGNPVASYDSRLRIREVSDDLVVTQKFTVAPCTLWDVDNPAVYRVVTTLKDAGGNTVDMVENPLGFRTFDFDAEKGFSLNGRRLKLMGTNRHQDYKEMGNALTDEMHVRDFGLLKDMGGNFLRISHYPQDPIMTQQCDRGGIVCSVEIPIVNAVTCSEAFRTNCVEMAREMVFQDYNSPSVIIWAYMNEVLLHIPVNTEDKEALKSYYDYAAATAKAVNDAIKEADPLRCTMIPCHFDCIRYKDSGLSDIPDILGWNIYNGWYGGGVETFAKDVRWAHSVLPDKPFILTEYGAGVDPRLHSRKPQRFDFSAEYGLFFHKQYIEDILNTDFIAGSNVWNLNDFYAEPRVDAVPHVNNKGIVGLDRVPKDSYYLYQAVLLKTPVVRIGGRDWTIREGNEGERQTVEVFSNCKTVDFYHNGKLVGCAAPQKGVASFEVCLENGDNYLKACSGTCEDAVHIRYNAVPLNFEKFTEMNVMLGSDRYFQDDISGTAWMPEQEYHPGSWGYVGGQVMPISSLDILGTINDPVFQTCRDGIEAFKADVPAGKYYVYLYFAELSEKKEGDGRIFSVAINGNKVLRDLDLRKEYGDRTAVIEKITVDVTGSEGLSIEFTPTKGSAVLNAVRIYKAI